MKILSISLIVFALTFGLGIGSAWMHPRPALSLAAAHSSESAPSSVTTTEAIVVQPIGTSAIDNQNIEETRIENFMDDRRIGRSRKNKIEIHCFSRGGERLAEIKFYRKTEYGAWIEAQSFRFEKDGVTGCDPIVQDFNNDGLRDFTYQSTVAARGANEVRRLFIYDKEKDELVYINNSQEYPNLAYNKKLNCIDSFMIHGASSTVFLRIEGDTLKEFASVGTGLERVVTVTDQSGEERVISRDKMNPDNYEEIYRRFSTYSPPR